MAIRVEKFQENNSIGQTVSGSLIEDRDIYSYIGIDLPWRKSDGVEGYFASTSTTVESIKNDIRNFMLTTQGERLYYPTLGLSLNKLLFEQINDDILANAEMEVVESFREWLPFVEIKKIDILTSDDDSAIPHNNLKVSLVFNIKNEPNMLHSITVTLGE